MAVRPLPAPLPGVLGGRLRRGPSQGGGAAAVSGDDRRKGIVRSSCLGDPGWGTYRAVRSGLVAKQSERKCAGKRQRTAASGVTKGRLETADRSLGALAKNCPGIQTLLACLPLSSAWRWGIGRSSRPHPPAPACPTSPFSQRTASCSWGRAAAGGPLVHPTGCSPV